MMRDEQSGAMLWISRRILRVGQALAVLRDSEALKDIFRHQYCIASVL